MTRDEVRQGLDALAAARAAAPSDEANSAAVATGTSSREATAPRSEEDSCPVTMSRGDHPHRGNRRDHGPSCDPSRLRCCHHHRSRWLWRGSWSQRFTAWPTG